MLCANKAEGAAGESGYLEAYALGLGEPVAISAERGEGLADLSEALRPFARGQVAETHESDEAPLRLAVVGRPNVGKSAKPPPRQGLGW